MGPFSGALIGARHVLTVAHGLKGKNPIGAGVVFTITTPTFPLILFPGFRPMTVPSIAWTAKAISMFPLTKVGQDCSPFCFDCDCAVDIAVLVLDVRLGDTLGMFGFGDISDNYDEFEDDKLSEAGVIGGVLQANLGTCNVVDGENCGWFSDPDGGFALTHNCDIVKGHSGGPVYLTPSPKNAVIVGVQSSQSWPWDENCAAGGGLMMSKINQAIKAFP